MSGRKQHLIPQMMIKRFAGTDGKLVELCKPELKIGTRRRSPRGVLFADDYYRDLTSDFDDDLLLEVEQNFAIHYPPMADDEKAARSLETAVPHLSIGLRRCLCELESI